MAVSGAPPGITASFSSDPTTGTSLVLTISTTAATPAVTTSIRVSATAVGITIAPLTVNLSVTPAVGPPVITGFAPTSGPVGTRVSISGSQFAGAQVVTFKGLSPISPSAFLKLNNGNRNTPWMLKLKRASRVTRACRRCQK